MTNTLLLVRHGETVWNRLRKIQGRSNSPLTELGKAQSTLNGNVIVAQGVTHIYASPAGRVRDSLACMKKIEQLPVKFDDRLLERDMGMWEELEWELLKRNWKSDYERCSANPRTERPPHGENLVDVETRASSVLRELFVDEDSAERSKNIAFVSHGGMSRSIMSWLGFMDRPEYKETRFHNDVVYKLTFETFDHIDVEHFVGGEGPYNGPFIETRE